MRRLAFATLSLLSLAVVPHGVAAPLSASPAVDVSFQQGALRPWRIAGELTGASTRAPKDILRDVVARHAPWAATLDLAQRDVVPFVDGTQIARFGQTIDGVPVLDRGARLELQKDGRATLFTSHLLEARPVSTKPSLPAAEALRIANEAGVPADGHGARLAILPTGGEPRLVYSVLAPSVGLPTRPTALIDAHTGEVVMQYETLVFDRKASVYAENPVATPTTSEVTLDNTVGKEGLQSPRVTAYNCIDKKAVKDISGFIKVHVCDLVRTVTPNAGGDYTDIKPLEGDEDVYAELSMFHHTSRVYNYVKTLGFPEAPDAVNAIANLRVPAGFNTFDTTKMANPDLPLARFDNAFFAAGDPTFGAVFGIDGDAMWFGQGTLSDFGWDGAVVYHEFGHYLVSRTIKFGGATHQDEFGLSYSPGGLNEGVADLYSFFLTKNGELGQYAAKGLAPSGKGIRSMTNKYAFPDALTGEVHQDSEPFTAGVWAVYSKLTPDQQTKFEKATMKLLMTAPSGDVGFGDFADALVTATGAGVDKTTADALAAAFKDRGMDKGNPRVRNYAGAKLGSVDPRLGIHAPSKKDMASKGDVAPGINQIKFDAPAGGLTKLHVNFAIVTRGGTFGSAGGSPFGGPAGTPYAPVLLAKAGGEPIKFTYGPTKHDAVQAPCTLDAAKKNATCDLDLDVAGKWGETAPVHLMLGNTGETAADINGIEVTADAPPDPGPGPGDDAGTNPATPEATTKSGCGCAVPGTTPAPSTAAAFAILGLALVIARRKR
ncbi:MAG: hypothetical protein IPJ34_36890 [Myxococcales bacterium]|nr:hypothetical protein [Myxococcales bacterium]